MFDYSKAFDSVNHIKIFPVMKARGFSVHLVSLLQSLYVNQRGTIRWNGESTEEFSMTKGVRHGSIAALYLFVA